MIARHDYQPFGEELTINQSSQRIAGFGYGSDNVRKKFTGYERDRETDLDFAQARYHNFILGRFNSPDPIMMMKKRLSDPQAINLYVYVRNNPLIYVDPDGLEYVDEERNHINVTRTANGQITVSCEKCVKGSKQLKDLQRMAGLVNKSGSEKAASQFMAGALNKTMNHFEFQARSSQNPTGRFGQQFPHDKDGKIIEKWDADNKKFEREPAYIKDENGNSTNEYVESTIVVYEETVNSRLGNYFQSSYNDPNLTTEEVMVGVFSHEIDHNTNKESIGEIRNGNKSFNPETSAYRVERQILGEIKENRAWLQRGCYVF